MLPVWRLREEIGRDMVTPKDIAKFELSSLEASLNTGPGPIDTCCHCKREVAADCFYFYIDLKEGEHCRHDLTDPNGPWEQCCICNKCVKKLHLIW